MSGAQRRLVAALARWRWPLLALWGCGWWLSTELRTVNRQSEWDFFADGGLSVAHYNAVLNDGLHVYVHQPALQIGPGILLPLAGLYRLVSPGTVKIGAGVVMALCSLVVVLAVERVAARRGELAAARGRRLAAELVLVGTWCYLAGYWWHLDDCLGLTAVAVAAAEAAGDARRRAWTVPVLLGLAAAFKPWLVLSWPLLVLVPRSRRAVAFLVALATTAIWWAPFLLSAPGTLSALGAWPVFSLPGSTLWGLGVRGDLSQWVRPVQELTAGAALLAVLRRRDVGLALVAAAVVKAALDPYVWPYYALLPLVAALVLDLRSRARAPWWSLATAAVWILPDLDNSRLAHAPVDVLSALVHLAWVAAAATAVVLGLLAGAATARPSVTQPADEQLALAS